MMVVMAEITLTKMVYHIYGPRPRSYNERDDGYTEASTHEGEGVLPVNAPRPFNKPFPSGENTPQYLMGEKSVYGLLRIPIQYVS